MKHSEIRDAHTVRTWLEQHGKFDTSAKMVARSSLRLQPLIWEEIPEASDTHLIQCIRLSIVSSVGAHWSGKERSPFFSALQRLAVEALSRTSDDQFVRYCQELERLGGLTAHAVDAILAADEGADLASAALGSANIDHSLWTEVRRDAELASLNEDLFKHPLWSARSSDTLGTASRSVPYRSRCFQAWQKVESKWRKASDPWPFFAQWYRLLLEGDPERWQIMERISLFPPHVWESDLSTINLSISAAVYDDKLGRVISASPHGWRVKVEERTGYFFAESVEPSDLTASKKDIRKILREFIRDAKDENLGGNRYGDTISEGLKPIIERLRRDISNSKDDALVLFAPTQRSMRRLELKSEEIGVSKAVPVRILLEQLQDACNIIELSSNDVRSMQKAKSDLEYEHLSRSQVLLGQKLVQSVETASLGALHAAAGSALSTIKDPEATEAKRKDAWYFVRSIVPRAYAAAQNSRREQELEAPVGEDSGKPLKILEQGAKLAKNFDVIIDAIQENGSEALTLLEKLAKLVG